MMTTPGFSWTDEKVAILRQRWDAGDSCSVIAAALRTTRNAVIGKMHRLKLSKPGRLVTARLSSAYAGPDKGSIIDASKPRPLPSRRRRAKAPSFGWPSEFSRRETPASAAASPVVVAAEEPRHISFADLTSTACRWPYGDGPSFTFCGCVKPDSVAEPYCAAHRAMAHAADQPRPVYVGNADGASPPRKRVPVRKSDDAPDVFADFGEAAE
jgi:GcrA cell cycle regulator